MNEFWTSKIDEQDWLVSKQHKNWLWPSMAMLLGERKIEDVPVFASDDFLKFFEKTVDDIRRKTKGTAEPIYSPSSSCNFNEFSPISPDDVIKVIGHFNQAIVTGFLAYMVAQQCTTELSPFIATLCKLSMSTVQVLSWLKVYITPFQEKENFNKCDITIDQFLIYQFCRNFWSVWSASNLLHTWTEASEVTICLSGCTLNNAQCAVIGADARNGCWQHHLTVAVASVSSFWLCWPSSPQPTG